MRVIFTLLALALPSLGVAACGGHGRGGSSAARTTSRVATTGRAIAPITAPTGRSLEGDGDGDNPSDIDGDNANDNDSDDDSRTRESYDYHDRDDLGVLNYGHAANVVDRRTVAGLVSHYYAAAARDDGVTACSLLSPGLARAVPEDYGRGAGPVYLRGGKTCQAIMSLLFRHYHGQLTGTVRVTGVRIGGDHAQAFVGSTTMPAGELSLERGGSSWKVGRLLGTSLP